MNKEIQFLKDLQQELKTQYLSSSLDQT
ncbi:hypothetical protein BSP21_107 [Bacillus phage BSP21]|nr:hypothetical protein IM043_gp126 [Bacillus phage SPG24]AYJ75442.1 hypothetical protein BSP21_107 [Bacillus phage BSP21]